MPDRLTRIYTRTGDDGSTCLADGTRLPKDERRIEALGALDELNCLIGLIIAHADPGQQAELIRIQHQLFELGAELALPSRQRIRSADVDWLEQVLDRHNDELPPLKEFILPGGNPAAAFCHLARAVCRRTERRLVTLGAHEPVNRETLRYLNRLSDLLFVLARVFARRDGGSETYWEPETPP